MKKNIFGFKIHRVYLATVLSLSVLDAVFSYVLKKETAGIIGLILSVLIIVGMFIIPFLSRKKEKIIVLIGIIIAIVGWLFGSPHFVLAEAVNGANEDFRNLDNEFLFAPLTQSDVDKAWDFVNSQNLSFTNVRVGIMDSGADLTGAQHPEFRNVPIFPTSPKLIIDDKEEGHGTQVTGIIGANNMSFPSSGNYEFPHMNGVVSGVHNLNYLIYLGKKPTLFDIGSSVDDLAENDVDVINMSFGTEIRQLIAFPLYKNFFTRAFIRNPDILFVASAGNFEFDVLGIDVDGINAELTLPAALGDNLPNVITVGATTLIPEDQRAGFSNYGDAVNVAAPGLPIYAPAPRGKGNFPGTAPQEDQDYDNSFGGTSASAPMVTGVAAILKALESEYQKYTQGFAMDPATIKSTLIASADPIDTGEPNKPIGKDCFNFITGTHTGCRLNAHRAVAWWFPPEPVHLNVPETALILSRTQAQVIPGLQQEEKEQLGVPGFTEFKFSHSQYPKAVLKTSEPIHLEYNPESEFISYQIAEPHETVTNIAFTIENLPPSTTLYLYQDSYKNKTEFTTDSDGLFSYDQDVSSPHNVWIQSIGGTLYIDRDTVLTGDINDAIEIVADNVTLDCNGHAVSAEGYYAGINIYWHNNVTVKNCSVSGFGRGISVMLSSSVELSSNELFNNSSGISISGGIGHKLFGNTIRDNSFLGLSVSPFNSSLLRNNQLSNNRFNFRVGHVSNFAAGDIDETNTINGKPITFFVNENNLTITDTSSMGYLGIIDSSNVIVRDTSLPSNNGEGIFVARSDNIKIENVSVSNNLTGIFLQRPYIANIAHNQIIGNVNGVELGGGPNVTVQDNYISSNGMFASIGVDFWASNSKLLRNNITGYAYGVFLLAHNGEIRDNVIQFNSYAGAYDSYGRNNKFIGNSFENNPNLGLKFLNTTGDSVFHNNFVNSVIPIKSSGSNNEFNNGSTNGGNYWNNFDEPAEGCNDLNNNKICDLPYIFTGGQDNYPWTIKNGWGIPQAVDVELSWSENEDPDFISYKIFRNTTGNVNTNDTLVATITDQNQTTHTDQELDTGQTHYYKVFTFDGAELSSGSNEESITL